MELKTFNGHTEWISSICRLDKNRFLSSSGDNTIKLWRIDTGECLYTFTGHNNDVTSICLLDKNRFLSGSRDKTIELWQIDTGKCLHWTYRLD